MRIDVVGEAHPSFDARAAASAFEDHFAETPLAQIVKSSIVSLSFVDEADIRELNATYRRIDEATDVLSFPLFEEEGKFVPPVGWDEVPLGDVVVAPTFVEREAGESGRSFERELRVVICHGVLHLMGYDHDTDERKDEMWTAQDAIADACAAIMRS